MFINLYRRRNVVISPNTLYSKYTEEYYNFGIIYNITKFSVNVIPYNEIVIHSISKNLIPYFYKIVKSDITINNILYILSILKICRVKYKNIETFQYLEYKYLDLIYDKISLPSELIYLIYSFI